MSSMDLGSHLIAHELMGVQAGAAVSGVISGDSVASHESTWDHDTFSVDGHNHDASYYTEAEIDASLVGKSDTGHTHDGRYYTESEINTQMSGKADTSHAHTIANVTNLQSSLDGKSDDGHDHDSRYFTETELTNQSTDLALDNLTVMGDMYVSGTHTIVDTETHAVEANIMMVNSGEPGTGVTAGSAGLEVDRGSGQNYFMLFDETEDHFEIGTSGSLQAVATREDAPIAGSIPHWNDTDKRFDTDADLTWDGSLLEVSGDISVSGDIVATSFTGDGSGLTGIAGGGTQTLTSSSGSVAWDINNGTFAKITLTENVSTFIISNMTNGDRYYLTIVQDSDTAKTVTFSDSAFKWPGGASAAPVVSTSLNAVDIIELISDGTNVYGVANYNFS